MFHKGLFCLIVIVSLGLPHMVSAGDIKYIGSSTVGAYITDAWEVYSGAFFTMETTPESDGGERAVLDGSADLGGVAREVRQNVLDQGVHQFLIGRDAIGVFVNQSNPVADLSFDQLKGIFTGNITNWKEVGGKNMKIDLFIVSPFSATYQVFKQVILGGDDYADKRLQTVHPDQMVLTKVAGNEGAIGHLSFALVDDTEDIKKIHVNGEAPTVNNPDYPVSRPLYLITKGEPQKIVQDFIDWTLSDQGQAIVKKKFVGIR